MTISNGQPPTSRVRDFSQWLTPINKRVYPEARKLSTAESRVRENCTHGSEGGESLEKALLYPYNKRPVKALVAIRFSPEVLAHFRAQGRGWQTRMDEALKEFIKWHPSSE